MIYNISNDIDIRFISNELSVIVHIVGIIQNVRFQQLSPAVQMDLIAVLRSQTQPPHQNLRPLYRQSPAQCSLSPRECGENKKVFGKNQLLHYIAWNSLAICMSEPIMATHLVIYGVQILMKFGHWEMICWVKKSHLKGSKNSPFLVCLT